MWLRLGPVSDLSSQSGPDVPVHLRREVRTVGGCDVEIPAAVLIDEWGDAEEPHVGLVDPLNRGDEGVVHGLDACGHAGEPASVPTGRWEQLHEQDEWAGDRLDLGDVLLEVRGNATSATTSTAGDDPV